MEELKQVLAKLKIAAQYNLAKGNMERAAELNEQVALVVEEIARLRSEG